MFCRQCGTEIPEDSRFCSNCGTAVDAATNTAIVPTAKTDIAKSETGAAAQAAPASPVPVMVWGIVGLTLSILFYFSIFGIIFSAIANKKAKNYIAQYGNASNMARVGKGLSKAGIIVGIINTIFLVLFFVFLFFVGYASQNM